MAWRVCLPPVCRQDGLAGNAGTLDLLGDCRYQATVTAGTIFQDSPYLPLTTWFRAMWQVTSQKKFSECVGIAASPGAGQLQNGLGHVAQAEASDGCVPAEIGCEESSR